MEGVMEYVPSSEKKELLDDSVIEKARETSYGLHDGFNEKVWNVDNKEKKSFHNTEHIRATGEAIDRLVDALQEDDFLNLKDDIRRWNNDHPDSQTDISNNNLDQFKKIAQLAFAFHDAGNIMKDCDFDSNGNPINIQYHENGYRANGESDEIKDEERAEFRSQIIFAKYIDTLELPDNVKQTYKNVGKEVIWQTIGFVDEEEMNKPFARFTRLIDQIGNDAFTENKDRIEGLLLEDSQDPSKTGEVNPYMFANFPRWRIKGILKKDENQQENIDKTYKAWGKNKPEEVAFYPRHDMSYEKAIEASHAANEARRIVEKHGGLTAEAEKEIKDKGFGLVISQEMRGYDEIKPEKESELSTLNKKTDKAAITLIRDSLRNNGNLNRLSREEGSSFFKFIDLVEGESNADFLKDEDTAEYELPTGDFGESFNVKTNRLGSPDSRFYMVQLSLDNQTSRVISFYDEKASNPTVYMLIQDSKDKINRMSFEKVNQKWRKKEYFNRDKINDMVQLFEHKESESHDKFETQVDSDKEFYKKIGLEEYLKE